MIEVFKIAANLAITGNAIAEMTRFIELVEKAAVRVEGLQSILQSSTRNIQTFNLSLGVSNKEFRSLNRSLYESIGKTSLLERNMKSLNKQMMMNSGANRAASRSGGGGGGFIGALGHRMGIGATVGTAAAFAGAGLVSSGFHAGLDYNHEMMQLTGQNLRGLSSSDQVSSYIDSANRGNLSKIALLSALNDAAVITKSASDAKSLAPILAKYKFTMEAMGIPFGLSQMQAAIKVPEIRTGSKDAGVIASDLDKMFKLSVSTGGRVMPSTILAATKSMRGYSYGMDPNFFYYMLEPLFQEYGTKTGPMISQFYQHMRVGRLTTQGAKLLAQGGLVDPKHIQHTKIGTIKGIDPGAILGTPLMGKNMFKWMDQYLPNFYKKLGANTLDDQLNVNGKIWTNSDLTLVNSYAQQRAKYMQAYAANLNTSGQKDIYGKNSNQLGIMTANTAQAWKDFSLAFQTFVNPTEIAGLKVLNFLLKEMSSSLSLFAKAGSHLPSPFQLFPGQHKVLGGIEGLYSAAKKSITHVVVNIGNEKIFAGFAKYLSNGNSINEGGQSSINLSYNPFGTSSPFVGFGP